MRRAAWRSVLFGGFFVHGLGIRGVILLGALPVPVAAYAFTLLLSGGTKTWLGLLILIATGLAGVAYVVTVRRLLDQERRDSVGRHARPR